MGVRKVRKVRKWTTFPGAAMKLTVEEGDPPDREGGGS
jgi:hypothetical protein